MNWDAIAAIAELAGALGVIVSLAYLATQIRQNTRQMADQGRALRLSAQEVVSSSFSRWRDLVIRDPEVATLWMRGVGGALSSPEEELRFGLLLQELLFAFQGVFLARTDGISSTFWSVELPVIRELLAIPPVAKWWERNKRAFGPEFVSTIESPTSSQQSSG